MKKLIYVLALTIAIVACNKDEQVDPVIPTPKNMSELEVSANFNWSASEEGVLYVTMENISDGNVSTEGQILLFIDNEDHILARSMIKNNQATFNLKLPEGDSKTYYLFYPNSANKQELQQINGQVNMKFAPSNGDRFSADRSSMVYDKELAFRYFNPNATNRSVHDLGSDLVQNVKEYRHPLEKIEISEAYPTFINWANTAGEQNVNWFTNKVENKVFSPYE